MKKIFLALSAAILLALGACQKAPELAVTGPASIEMSADGSSGSITFTANRDWTVSSSESWVHINPVSGAASDGPVTVSVKCDANTTYNDRTATVTIKAEDLTQSVTIRQPQNLGVIVPAQTYDVKAGAQSIEVEVQANTDYSVSINADWIKQNGTKTLMSKKLTFSIEENKTYDSREGRITIKPQNGSVAEQVISVKQQAKDGLELGKTIYEVGVSGGTLEIALKTNVELEVKPGVDWIHYTQTKALDNRTVILSIDQNDGDAERSGEVKIGQKGGSLSSTVTVKQEKKPTLTVEQTEYTVGPDGGALEIALKTNVELEVKPDADWIHYTETKALDNKTIILSIDSNDGKTRSGTVTISQKNGTLFSTVTVKQEKPVLECKTKSYSINGEGGTLEITVRTNVEFEVTPEVDWIHYIQTKSSSDRTVTLSIDFNSKCFYKRDGQVMISSPKRNLQTRISVRQGVPEIVDLGLSVKWRNYNLGATTPDGYGKYYAWGETETKADYSWSKYKYGTSKSALTKYVTRSPYGTVDNKTVLEEEDDVAHVLLGGSWRMPTKEEFFELLKDCEWKWANLYESLGYRVTGPNGNAIFLPAAGYRDGKNLEQAGSYGRYWSSTLSNIPTDALGLWFNSKETNRYSDYRYTGYSVRPVTK